MLPNGYEKARPVGNARRVGGHWKRERKRVRVKILVRVGTVVGTEDANGVTEVEGIGSLEGGTFGLVLKGSGFALDGSTLSIERDVFVPIFDPVTTIHVGLGLG